MRKKYLYRSSILHFSAQSSASNSMKMYALENKHTLASYGLYRGSRRKWLLAAFPAWAVVGDSSGSNDARFPRKPVYGMG